MISLAPGPSALYFTVFDHTRRAFRDGIPSMSHRSKEFEFIFREVDQGLRQLLNIPDDFCIAFTSSATEVWERSIQNLVSETSFHLVNGAFSKRFFEISTQLGRHATCLEAPAGSGFGEVLVPPSQELIGLTQNETSTGVTLPMTLIQSVRKASPESLLVVDAVSSLPYPVFDFSQVDSVFFSVQKGFGMPPGLGVWIFNERCIERASALQTKGKHIGTYHSLPSLASFARKNQTPETPNTLAIYVLGKVIADFLRRGIDTIRRETEYKSTLLYQALDNHPVIRPFVRKPEDRSKTVITVATDGHTSDLITFLSKRGFQAGEGYGSFKSTQVRIANFPAHSKEQYEALADALAEFKK